MPIVDDWYEDELSRSFRELDRVTALYQSLKFKDLVAVLESEMDRSGERVQFFGAQIPAAGLENWGVPIIGALQIYLLLHLMGLRSRTNHEDPARDFPWIGAYRDRWAERVVSISAFFFPVATIAFLTYPSVGKTLKLAKMSLFLIASISIAIASFNTIEGVRLKWKEPAE